MAQRLPWALPKINTHNTQNVLITTIDKSASFAMGRITYICRHKLADNLTTQKACLRSCLGPTMYTPCRVHVTVHKIKNRSRNLVQTFTFLVSWQTHQQQQSALSYNSNSAPSSMCCLAWMVGVLCLCKRYFG